MILEDVLAQIHEPQALEALRPHWEESVASLPEMPPFLLPEAVRTHCEWCGLEPPATEVLLATARRVAENPALRALAWHCDQLLFDHEEYAEVRAWPPLEGVLGELAGAFYLLVALAMVPRVRAKHRELGVAEEVTRETCQEIWCFSDNYRRGHDGRVGIPLNQLFWLRLYPAGRLFRVGRFEYKLQPYNGGVEVYRDRETGETIALAPDGMRFNREGYVDGNAGVFDPDAWTATLAVDEEHATGTPFAPMGMAVCRQVRLPLARWERVLGKGEMTLDMHIPAGGGMSPALCGDSMRRATAFFRETFPDKPFRSITCFSWLFNTQLEQILPPDANLVQYQRELYLFPTPSGGRDGLWFIFLKDDFDPATLPRDTRLRRAVADFLAAGNQWRGGGMFFLTDDLDRFGTQHYRTHWMREA